MNNPKVLTTWLALMSRFPISQVVCKYTWIYPTLCRSIFFWSRPFTSFFLSRKAAGIYLALYRPLTGLVIIGFFVYVVKLLSGAFV